MDVELRFKHKARAAQVSTVALIWSKYAAVTIGYSLKLLQPAFQILQELIRACPLNILIVAAFQVFSSHCCQKMCGRDMLFLFKRLRRKKPRQKNTFTVVHPIVRNRKGQE
jgi:hypothetical protein